MPSACRARSEQSEGEVLVEQDPHDVWSIVTIELNVRSRRAFPDDIVIAGSVPAPELHIHFGHQRHRSDR